MIFFISFYNIAAIHLHTTIFFCYSVSILWLKIKACQRCTEIHKKIFSFKVEVLVTQSCLILCNPIDCSPPSPSVHGILQARILKWVAMPFSRASSPPWIEPKSPSLQADSLLSEPPGEPFLSKFLL